MNSNYLLNHTDRIITTYISVLKKQNAFRSDIPDGAINQAVHSARQRLMLSPAFRRACKRQDWEYQLDRVQPAVIEALRESDLLKPAEEIDYLEVNFSFWKEIEHDGVIVITGTDEQLRKALADEIAEQKAKRDAELNAAIDSMVADGYLKREIIDGKIVLNTTDLIPPWFNKDAQG